MVQVIQKKNSKAPEIINRLISGALVDKEAIVSLLALSHPADLELLFTTARSVRSSHFNNHIFLYGFLYFSTFCRNDCSFCQYRRSNTQLKRYRKTQKEIMAAALKMAAEGVHLIDLTMGEDPYLVSNVDSSHKRLENIIKAVQSITSLPLMISPGVVAPGILDLLHHTGVNWYACYQETHSISHFRKLRRNQSFSKRLEMKKKAQHLGMMVEEGILLGAGEKMGDIADSLLFMQKERFDQVRAMTFIAPESNGADPLKPQRAMQELITIAVMRLLMPDRLIPASLDVDGLDGLGPRLDAGANVITSIVPPDNALAGVANTSLDIEDARRSIQNVKPVLQTKGLKIADPDMYTNWLESRRKNNKFYSANPENIMCV